jgi:cell wall integrity and stress response component
LANIFIQTSSTTSDPQTTTEPATAVTTVAGEIVTITKPNGEPASTSEPSGSPKDGGSSLSGGAIAGIVIGVLAIAIIALFLLWFLVFRRRRPATPDDPDSRLDPSNPNSAYLNGNHRHNRSSQMSMMNGFFDSNGYSNSNRNRLSVPGFTDNRMKKDAVIYGHDGRESNVSLQDNQDYSRPVLRVSYPLSFTLRLSQF